MAAAASLSGAQAWGLEEVAQLAAQRASQAWVQPAHTGPAGLGYDQLRALRFRPERRLWRQPALPFQAEFLHGAWGGDGLRLHELTPQGVREIPHRFDDYTAGQLPHSPALSESHRQALGHGGVKLLHPLHSPARQDEVMVFQGASYFRALGRHQRYGLSARGLAVDTPGQEEFPRFTDVWLEPPQAASRTVRLWALLDSPRVTGAYAFEVSPGESTQVRVQARLFIRPGQPPIQTLGLAPLTSMFFFGENQPRAGDFRPEVHDSDGLMIAAANGEWLWRPLSNPRTPQLSSFHLEGLKGFGLMQRDRHFASYEDTEARYELRPSAWVTPLGDWGAGRVELYQFHTPDETHDNVSAYWVPQRLPTPEQPLNLAYLISWQGAQAQRPPGGWTLQSRLGTGYQRADELTGAQPVQYVVDFTGPPLQALPEGAPVHAVVSLAPPGRVLESLVYRHPVHGAWRMTLRIARPEPAQALEVRAFLQHGKDTLTETWTTVITP
jgi:glucans biosynthesis protein